MFDWLFGSSRNQDRLDKIITGYRTHDEFRWPIYGYEKSEAPDTERRIAELEARLAALEARLDEQDGGK